MKYTIHYTKQFERALRKCEKRGYSLAKLSKAIQMLSENGTLPRQYLPHKLVGQKGGNVWECHIQPDWLLTWRQYDNELVLLMLDTGTHADLF